jgi:hypothetical protein
MADQASSRESDASREDHGASRETDASTEDRGRGLSAVSVARPHSRRRGLRGPAGRGHRGDVGRDDHHGQFDVPGSGSGWQRAGATNAMRRRHVRAAGPVRRYYVWGRLRWAGKEVCLGAVRLPRHLGGRRALDAVESTFLVHADSGNFPPSSVTMALAESGNTA